MGGGGEKLGGCGEVGLCLNDNLLACTISSSSSDDSKNEESSGSIGTGSGVAAEIGRGVLYPEDEAVGAKDPCKG